MTPTSPTTSPPRLPGLKLRPIRSPGSSELDGRQVRPRGEPPAEIPPYEPWPRALAHLARYWDPGQHMALVARAGSGKTTAARRLLALRDWVVVFGTKEKDPDLYEALIKQGYVVKSSWDPSDLAHNRVIFKPPLDLSLPLADALKKQRQVFERALVELFQVGGWTAYFDEVRYLALDLRLTAQLDLLWLQGRSNNITIVAGTQRPRSVPLNMFEQAAWFCLWRINDRDDRARASEMLGPLRGVAFEAMAMLPRHELMLVDLNNDLALRTKVDA